ncbi:MAG: T9SS type A sorting domain-containing protein [Ignavibacteriae bacterium]|nr:T9SS C-terminal target domain-containing protein [Ignavibacteriota bacterium]NOG97354.1 T9SS type A sorting domain-containing protein [Ignavibacteriota bacterium]
MLEFNTTIGKNYITLHWSTATEINNYGFEIERAKFNSVGVWKKLAFINGNGNSNYPHNYEYTDKTARHGNEYLYRLKQIDNDGNYSYLEEIKVNFGGALSYSLNKNYPNPFNPSTKISFEIPQKSKVTLKVYDLLGNEIVTLIDEEIEAGIYETEFRASDLASGIYYYRIQAGLFVETKKMMLLR